MSHFNRFHLRGVGLVALILVLGISGTPADPTTPSVAPTAPAFARIGGTDVSITDVQAVLETLTPEQRTALQEDPKAFNQLVRQLLLQRVVVQEALLRQWDKHPDVARQLKSLHDTFVARAYLKSVSEPPPDFPAPAQVQQIYDANKSSFIIPKQYHLAQIFVAAGKTASQAANNQAKAKLDSIHTDLTRPGADFEAVARIQSDDPISAQKGGVIGWVTDAQVQPELRSRVIGLKPKIPSEPFRLDDGWHILEILEIKESYLATLDEVRPLIVERLRSQQEQINERNYESKLLQENPIAINELELAKLMKPPVVPH